MLLGGEQVWSGLSGKYLRDTCPGVQDRQLTFKQQQVNQLLSRLPLVWQGGVGGQGSVAGQERAIRCELFHPSDLALDDHSVGFYWFIGRAAQHLAVRHVKT